VKRVQTARVVVQVFDVKGVFCCNAGFPVSGIKRFKTHTQTARKRQQGGPSKTGQPILPAGLDEILLIQVALGTGVALNFGQWTIDNRRPVFN
jgi:hypothetical protein